jgi:hypothetical protein
MPSWQPKWDDVQFDHAEANEAVLLCQGALVTLADRHAVLQGPYQMACVNWRGVKRYRFDAEWSAMHVQAEAIAEQLRIHIVKLQRDSSAALIEQRTREAERARWFREKAAEEAAAAAAREAARIAAAQAAAAQAAAASAAAAAQAAAAAAAQRAASAASTQSAAVKPALTFAPISSAPATSSPTPAAAPASNPTSTPAATETSKPTTTFSPVTRASGQLSGR